MHTEGSTSVLPGRSHVLGRGLESQIRLHRRGGSLSLQVSDLGPGTFVPLCRSLLDFSLKRRLRPTEYRGGNSAEDPCRIDAFSRQIGRGGPWRWQAARDRRLGWRVSQLQTSFRSPISAVEPTCCTPVLQIAALLGQDAGATRSSLASPSLAPSHCVRTRPTIENPSHNSSSSSRRFFRPGDRIRHRRRRRRRRRGVDE